MYVNDQELIRKAVQETAAEYDIEKWRPLLAAATALAPRVAGAISTGVKAVRGAVTGSKGTGGLKSGFKGTSPKIAPKPATTSPSTGKTYGSSRLEAKYGGGTPKPKPGSTQYRTATGRMSTTAGPTVAQRTGSAVRTAKQNLGKTTLKTPAGRRTALKYGGRGVAAAGVAGIVAAGVHGAVTKPKADGQGGASGYQGPTGGLYNPQDFPKSPEDRLQTGVSERGASRFMGRTGKSGHARQMMESYKPKAEGYPKLKMLKEFLNNDTSPQLATSMPTTSIEMPASIFNASMAEIAGQALPPVYLKVNEQDEDAQKVTEAVMDKLEKQSQQMPDLPPPPPDPSDIGRGMIDQLIWQPEMMNLGRKEKKLQQKFAGMKFDEDPNSPTFRMPLHPKTNEVLSEKEMIALYGTATRSSGLEEARGRGQAVLAQQAQGPPPPTDLPTPGQRKVPGTNASIVEDESA